MKNLIMGLILLGGTSLFAQDELKIDGGVNFLSKYIFRGTVSSDHSTYNPYISWEKGAFSGNLSAYYETSNTNYLTDFDSDWLEFDTELYYTFHETKNESFTAGYTYYGYNDDWYDSQELSLTWNLLNNNWNPYFKVSYDFDFYEGAYLQAGVSQTKIDREWEYTFGMGISYLSDYGKPMLDKKNIKGIIYANQIQTFSGMADFTPSIQFVKHLDEESSLSLELMASIILDNDTYNNTAKDEFIWRVGYDLQF